jgi:cytochrome oxidase Cu insertion factor (SCO1/SenC/PrrC family)|tara:strand:+ start:358 stop:642 length:285 start_codon:yes stop_codon:yes gene_type:complete
MTEIVLKPELIKGLQKVLVDYEPANEDPILAAQYLAAVVGSIVATANIPKNQQDDILKQLLDFIKYVYDQQTQASAPAKQDNQPSEAFGKWKPK